MSGREQGVSRWRHFRAALARQARGRGKDSIAIAVLTVLAIVMTLWIFTQQKASLPSWAPFVGEDFVHLTADFSDAQAVTPGQGQAVVISGIQVGKIDSVDLEDGHAVVGMQVEPRYLDLIHPNATLLLRPKTNLNDMTVEISPGSGSKHVEAGHRFPLSQTEPSIQFEAFLSPARHRYAALPAAARRRRGTGDRRARPPARQRLPAPAAVLPLHRQTQPGGRPAPRRALPRDPRLRPADGRTGPPRLRARTLRHLLQGRARQLRQPAAGAAGIAARIPLHADRAELGARRVEPLLRSLPARRCSA